MSGWGVYPRAGGGALATIPDGMSAVNAVYPRAGGGATIRTHLDIDPEGLSPRGRGSRRLGLRRRLRLGSIPARAGEPAGRRLSRHAIRVYPRAGGGAGIVQGRDRGIYPRAGGGAEVDQRVAPSVGLSPRGAGEPSTSGGSIPARAGEPRPRHLRRPPRGLSPRGRGSRSVVASLQPGLSPRA